MPKIAQPLVRLKIPLSNKIKLIIVLLIFLTSYSSGKITVLNTLAKHGQPFQDTQRVLSSVASIKNHKGDLVNLYRNQIKQVAIGQTTTPRATPTPEITWGKAEKIDTHTYTMQVQQDNNNATSQEILTALNNYRGQHGRGELTWNDTLANFATSRAESFSQKSSLDNHAGFLDYLNNQDGFKKLGFSSIGENSSLGFTLEAVHLIEWVYAGDEGHNSNQLNNDWRYVGIGVNGSATDLIFAGNKM